MNFDNKWNFNLTFSGGLAIITNVTAYARGYVAFYPGNKKASSLRGWGASIAPLPYTQVRIGGTTILASGNLLTIFNKWKIGAKKVYKALGTKVIMKKAKNMLV